MVRCNAYLSMLATVVVGVCAAGTSPAEAINEPLGADWSQLSETMDGTIKAVLQENGVSGCVVTIVRDDEVAYAGAFGEARPGVAVSHTETLFAVASITKTLTVLAAAHLAEAGQLDLDADISDYLGAKSPATPLGTVTMRDLLTHTSGFDNSDIGDAAQTIHDVVSLPDLVASRITRQTTPPGAFYKYSSFGYALAGLVIENVSGKPYGQFVQETLLSPLGMSSSFIEQPVPKSIGARLALGRTAYSADTLPWNFTQLAPADGLVATADDMGKYLMFQTGAAKNDNVLQNLGVMHKHQFGFTSSVPTMALGWEEYSWSGHRALTHTGGLPGFTSFIGMLPNEGVGIFIALNTRDSNARTRILVEFLSKFIPQAERTKEQASKAIASPHDPTDYEGTFLSQDYPRGFERWMYCLGLTGETISVSSTDGIVQIDGVALTEYAEERFWSDAETEWHFVRDNHGSVVHVHKGRDTFRRLAAYEKPETLLNLLLLGFAVATVRGVIVPVFGFLFKRRLPGSKAVTLACLALSVCAVATVVSLSNSPSFDFGLPPSLRWSVLANAVAVALSVVLAVVFLFREPELKRWVRGFETLTLVGVAPYAIILVAVGLAGWA